MSRILCIGFLVLLLFGCSTAPKKPASLRLAFNAPPATLDPRKSGDFLSSTLIVLIYEGLTRYAKEGGVEPGIAESWDISDDGLVYTFHLRKSFWSDGRSVTAYDFEKSWKTILDPSFSSLSAYLLFPIKNAERCAKKEIRPEEVAVKALDDRTLRVELERPTSYFLSLTAFPLFLPAPAHSPGEGEVCNGPFRIERNEPNSEIRLAKNPSYWHPEKISLDEIRIQVIPDENTALQLFERGQLDWLGAPLAPLPPDSLLALKDKLLYIPSAASTILAFNTETSPFRNLKLRKALSLSIDKGRLLSEIAPGQIPAARPLPPNLFDRSLEPLFHAPDLELAHSLCAEAFSEMGIATLDGITLYFKSATGIEKRLAQALQREWKTALGLDIQIEQLDPKAHLDRLHQRDYQIAIGLWIAQFPDPINILERYRLPSNKKNFAGWLNSDFSSLVEQSASELDPQKRTQLLLEAERIFAEEIPVFPLYHWANPSLSNPRLKEVAISSNGDILFEQFKVIED